jgi:2-polyprenyl-3-methyl-5-hydroxy-6-metoxy-1,4-benzoquinol methylase
MSSNDQPAARQAISPPGAPWKHSWKSHLLSAVVSAWPNTQRRRTKSLGAEPGTAAHARAYAVRQFTERVDYGLCVLRTPPLWGLRVLEVGCGHGGIACYLASIGPRQVLGVDLNRRNLSYARELKTQIEEKSGRALPLNFAEMDATGLALADASFDVVVAANVFEHFVEPGAVLRELRRILAPGGLVIIPVFSSIKSKHGLHLKHGLKLPWANLVFSERTILGALDLQARKRPELFEIYPGLADRPQRVRDVRRYGDLNDITYGSFRELAIECGFRIRDFRVHSTLTGKILRRLFPKLESTIVFDVLSTGAAAVLEVPRDETPKSRESA